MEEKSRLGLYTFCNLIIGMIAIQSGNEIYYTFNVTSFIPIFLISTGLIYVIYAGVFLERQRNLIKKMEENKSLNNNEVKE